MCIQALGKGKLNSDDEFEYDSGFNKELFMRDCLFEALRSRLESSVGLSIQVRDISNGPKALTANGYCSLGKTAIVPFLLRQNEAVVSGKLTVITVDNRSASNLIGESACKKLKMCVMRNVQPNVAMIPTCSGEIVVNKSEGKWKLNLFSELFRFFSSKDCKVRTMEEVLDLIRDDLGGVQCHLNQQPGEWLTSAPAYAKIVILRHDSDLPIDAEDFKAEKRVILDLYAVNATPVQIKTNYSQTSEVVAKAVPHGDVRAFLIVYLFPEDSKVERTKNVVAIRDLPIVKTHVDSGIRKRDEADRKGLNPSTHRILVLEKGSPSPGWAFEPLVVEVSNEIEDAVPKGLYGRNARAVEVVSASSHMKGIVTEVEKALALKRHVVIKGSSFRGAAALADAIASMSSKVKPHIVHHAEARYRAALCGLQITADDRVVEDGLYNRTDDQKWMNNANPMMEADPRDTMSRSKCVLYHEVQELLRSFNVADLKVGHVMDEAMRKLGKCNRDDLREVVDILVRQQLADRVRRTPRGTGHAVSSTFLGVLPSQLTSMDYTYMKESTTRDAIGTLHNKGTKHMHGKHLGARKKGVDDSGHPTTKDLTNFFLEQLLAGNVGKVLFVDNDTRFLSAQFVAAVMNAGVRLRVISSNSPHGNAQIERGHRTVKDIVALLIQDPLFQALTFEQIVLLALYIRNERVNQKLRIDSGGESQLVLPESDRLEYSTKLDWEGTAYTPLQMERGRQYLSQVYTSDAFQDVLRLTRERAHLLPRRKVADLPVGELVDYFTKSGEKGRGNVVTTSKGYVHIRPSGSHTKVIQVPANQVERVVDLATTLGLPDRSIEVFRSDIPHLEKLHSNLASDSTGRGARLREAAVYRTCVTCYARRALKPGAAKLAVMTDCRLLDHQTTCGDVGDDIVAIDGSWHPVRDYKEPLTERQLEVLGRPEETGEPDEAKSDASESELELSDSESVGDDDAQLNSFDVELDELAKIDSTDQIVANAVFNGENSEPEEPVLNDSEKKLEQFEFQEVKFSDINIKHGRVSNSVARAILRCKDSAGPAVTDPEFKVLEGLGVGPWRWRLNDISFSKRELGKTRKESYTDLFLRFKKVNGVMCVENYEPSAGTSGDVKVRSATVEKRPESRSVTEGSFQYMASELLNDLKNDRTRCTGNVLSYVPEAEPSLTLTLLHVWQTVESEQGSEARGPYEKSFDAASVNRQKGKWHSTVINGDLSTGDCPTKVELLPPRHGAIATLRVCSPEKYWDLQLNLVTNEIRPVQTQETKVPAHVLKVSSKDTSAARQNDFGEIYVRLSYDGRFAAPLSDVDRENIKRGRQLVSICGEGWTAGFRKQMRKAKKIPGLEEHYAVTTMKCKDLIVNAVVDEVGGVFKQKCVQVGKHQCKAGQVNADDPNKGRILPSRFIIDVKPAPVGDLWATMRVRWAPGGHHQERPAERAENASPTLSALQLRTLLMAPMFLIGTVFEGKVVTSDDISVVTADVPRAFNKSFAYKENERPRMRLPKNEFHEATVKALAEKGIILDGDTVIEMLVPQYGLIEASLQWFLTARGTLLEDKRLQSRINCPCVYRITLEKQTVAWAGQHVDDFIGIGITKAVNLFTDRLHEKFQIEKVDIVNATKPVVFVGRELYLSRSNGGFCEIGMSQKCAELKELTEPIVWDTPMTDSQVEQFRSIRGACGYIHQARPDQAYNLLTSSVGNDLLKTTAVASRINAVVKGYKANPDLRWRAWHFLGEISELVWILNVDASFQALPVKPKKGQPRLTNHGVMIELDNSSQSFWKLKEASYRPLIAYALMIANRKEVIGSVEKQRPCRCTLVDWGCSLAKDIVYSSYGAELVGYDEAIQSSEVSKQLFAEIVPQVEGTFSLTSFDLSDSNSVVSRLLGRSLKNEGCIALHRALTRVRQTRMNGIRELIHLSDIANTVDAMTKYWSYESEKSRRLRELVAGWLTLGFPGDKRGQAIRRVLRRTESSIR